MRKDMGSSSSGNRPAAPATPADAGAKGALFIDWGPALPESYGVPRIVALVRDPRVFFATWEEGDRIRARDLTAKTSEEHAVARIGSWYFEGTPEHDYEIDLLSNGKVVAVSGRLHLPRLDPAAGVDPEWVPTEGQEELLRAFLLTMEPFVHEVEVSGNSKAWRRRVAGMPVSRPSRTS
jgi:hypothetical protein